MESLAVSRQLIKLRPFLALLVGLLVTSCATEKEVTIERAGSQVFKLPREGGFQWETLELKDGHFRYWFSGDVIGPKHIKYPLEGSYEFRGNHLILSNGKTYTVRQLNGIRSLWLPRAVDWWEQQQIIDVYGILLPAENIRSDKPTLEPLFTKEQWNKSAEQVRQLEQKR